MANESNNKVGEFTVAPETLISKADQIKTSLSIVSAFMKMIEDAFKGIEDEEIWQGPLAEKYFENAKNFFKGGATLDDDSTNAGYNTYSTNVLAYADKVYAFLNEASGGYLETDTNVEKSVSGEDGGFIGPMPQDATGKTTEQEPTTSAANVATTVAGAAGVAGATYNSKEERKKSNVSGKISYVTDSTSVISTDTPVVQGQSYELTQEQINYLAYTAKKEQGSVEGAKIELSLMANQYEKSNRGYDNIQSYVYDSGWYSDSSTSNYEYPGDEYVAAVEEVLVDGNRYLPTNVNEHDYMGDITSVTVNGQAIDKNDRSAYVPYETVIKNKYGSTYTFVGFAPGTQWVEGDPFGYTS